MLQDFSSMPPEQEREFVVFEQRLQSSSKSALTIGAIVGGVLGLLIVAIVLSGSEPEPLIKVEEPEAAPAAAPSRPTPEPPPAAEAAAAVPETAAEPTEAAPAQEAPKPPPGATKAPPTALTGGK